MKNFLIILVLILSFSATYATDPFLVGSKDVPDRLPNKEAVLDLRQVIDIFTKKQRKWEDHSEIVVVMRKQSSIPNRQFLTKVLGLTPYQYKSRLYENIYRGRAEPPIEVESEEKLLEYISNHERSIGYIYDYIVINEDDRITFIKIDDL